MSFIATQFKSAPAGTSFNDTNIVPGKSYSYRVAAVNTGQLANPEQSTAVIHQISQPLTQYSLTLATRDSYLPGVAVLVQVEITGDDGKPAKDVWDAVATLTSSNPAVTLSTSEVRLRNGLGSVLVTFTGSGPFTLTASSGGIQTQRAAKPAWPRLPKPRSAGHWSEQKSRGAAWFT